MIEYLGLIYLGLLALNAWGALAVLGARAGLVRSAMWLAILCLPGLGFVAWYLVGPRAAA